MNTVAGAAPTPRHLWIVGILSLLWNAFGAVDYVLTQIGHEGYLAMFTAEQRAYFESFPAWSVAAWACGVWGAFAGSVLLLMRQRFAVQAFGLSLAGMAVSFGYQFAMTDVLAVMGAGMAGFTLVIVAIGIGLFVYARRQAARGMLH